MSTSFANLKHYGEEKTKYILLAAIEGTVGSSTRGLELGVKTYDGIRIQIRNLRCWRGVTYPNPNSKSLGRIFDRTEPFDKNKFSTDLT